MASNLKAVPARTTDRICWADPFPLRPFFPRYEVLIAGARYGPSWLSVLQEPAACRNGCAVLHFVAAVPVRATPDISCIRPSATGPQQVRPPEWRLEK